MHRCRGRHIHDPASCGSLWDVRWNGSRGNLSCEFCTQAIFNAPADPLGRIFVHEMLLRPNYTSWSHQTHISDDFTGRKSIPPYQVRPDQHTRSTKTCLAMYSNHAAGLDRAIRILNEGTKNIIGRIRSVVKVQVFMFDARIFKDPAVV